ncbi:hypothetical protein C8R44DRAFT_869880 [Mycena epipterygia]|nr:hypothetical protein C8R44DRAFT_869880 [Mycena epipterygia]
MCPSRSPLRANDPSCARAGKELLVSEVLKEQCSGLLLAPNSLIRLASDRLQASKIPFPGAPRPLSIASLEIEGMGVLPPHLPHISSYAQHLLNMKNDFHGPIEQWLARNIHTWPQDTGNVGRDDVLYLVNLQLTKAPDDGTMEDGPDYYTLWLHIEGLSRHNWSPLVILGKHYGSSSDGDTPTWTCTMEFRTIYKFSQPRIFMAELLCGLMSI